MAKLYYESKPGELEHGLFDRLKRKNAKYIEKIPVGSGKYRYFYTQEELDAYYAEQKSIRDKKHQDARANAQNTHYDRNPEYHVITDYNNHKSGKTYAKTSGIPGSRYGTFERTNETGGTDTVIRKKSNKLLSSKSKLKFRLNADPKTTTKTTYNEGLLERNARYTGKKIDEMSDNVKKSAKKTAAKIKKKARKASKSVKKTVNSIIEKVSDQYYKKQQENLDKEKEELLKALPDSLAKVRSEELAKTRARKREGSRRLAEENWKKKRAKQIAKSWRV